MSPTEKTQVVELISRLWPKADWAKELQVEFGRRMDGLQITTEQAQASLVNLRMNTKFVVIQPREVWEALRSASGPDATGENSDGLSPAAEACCRWLDRFENRQNYQDAARHWLATNIPKAFHLADCSGALLQPRDPLYGPWSRRFLAWYADGALRKGVHIGVDGEILSGVN